MAGVDAYGLLVEEFKSEEIQDQLAAAKRINTIAVNMGPDRSRSQLLPFLRLVHALKKAAACSTRAAPPSLRSARTYPSPHCAYIIIAFQSQLARAPASPAAAQEHVLPTVCPSNPSTHDEIRGHLGWRCAARLHPGLCQLLSSVVADARERSCG